MTNLTHEQFLAELGKLFMASRLGGPGAVSVTLKHCKCRLLILIILHFTDNGQTKPTPKTPTVPKKGGEKHVEENSCLFRAKLGRKVIRTVVCHHFVFLQVLFLISF